MYPVGGWSRDQPTAAALVQKEAISLPRPTREGAISSS